MTELVRQERAQACEFGIDRDFRINPYRYARRETPLVEHGVLAHLEVFGVAAHARKDVPCKGEPVRNALRLEHAQGRHDRGVLQQVRRRADGAARSSVRHGAANGLGAALVER